MTGTGSKPGRSSGPVPYERLRQRVRRHRQTDVLVAVAALNARLQQAEFGRLPPLRLPNFVTPFALAGVARTAIMVANDHRDSPVGMPDLIEMCSLYANVAEPALDHDPGAERLRSVLTHMAYEQFGHQHSAMENLGRTLVLLSDHAGTDPAAPTPEDWAAGLGAPLEALLRIGFAMHVAAVSNGGAIDRSILAKDDVAPIFAPLTADDALGLVDRWFASPPSQLRTAGLAEEVQGQEKWSLSPLVGKPIVSLPDGRYVTPWPRLVLDRITPTGLYFTGLELFGSSFPDRLGAMFESYVGTQLSLLRHAQVHPQKIYGRHGERTVDFFLATPEVLVLIEVKAARPVRSTRLGQPAGDDDVARKVGHAFDQIERSAALVRQGHPAVADLVEDRPLLALVVTLEPFYLLNTLVYDDVLSRPSIPTLVISSHEMEGAVAALQTCPDLGARLLGAVGARDGHTPKLQDALAGLPGVPNPLLDEAWERFSYPWAVAA